MAPNQSRRVLTLALLAAIPLAGCKIIDQTTFFPEPGPPAVAAPAAPGPSSFAATPLLTIRVAPGVEYRAALRTAVRAARARRADVIFDVYAAIPTTGSTEQQVAASQQQAAHARNIADAIRAEGVPASQIMLGTRTEAGLDAPEIRVFVR